MLSFLHPSLPRSRVSNGSPMGDYVWDFFTRLIQAPQWSFCFSSWSTYTPSSTLQPYQIPPWSSHPLLLIKTLQWLPTCPQDCCSVAKLCPTPCDPMNCSTPGFPVLHYLLEFAQTHVQVSQWCHPTISSSVAHFFSCPQSFPTSRSFPVNQLCIRWPKYWSLSFSISPPNVYSLRTD